jgi:hypothetical protein
MTKDALVSKYFRVIKLELSSIVVGSFKEVKYFPFLKLYNLNSFTCNLLKN